MPSAITLSAPLTDLADDVRTAAWLLAADDPLRAYLEMLAALPPEVEAWTEVLSPWLDAARHGRGPQLTDRAHLAVAGALVVAALRAARELPADSPLAASLRSAARWCLFLVDPSLH